MSNKKSCSIAIVMVAMFITILVCLFLLKAWVICGIVIGLCAALGIICATNWLIEWLRDTGKESKKKHCGKAETDPLEVPPVVEGDPVGVDFEQTFDEIKRSEAACE